MSISLWLYSSSEVSSDTKYGVTEHLGKKKLLQSAFQIFRVWKHQRAALPTESRSESWKTAFKQIFIAGDN